MKAQKTRTQEEVTERSVSEDGTWERKKLSWQKMIIQLISQPRNEGRRGFRNRDFRFEKYEKQKFLSHETYAESN